MLVFATSGVAWVVAIVVALLFSLWGTNMAEHRGRNKTVWGIVCFLTGLLGIIVLAFVPKTEEKKREEVQKYIPTVPDTVPVAWTEEIRQLSDLHDAGTLSDEEFAHEKERILAHH